ncbi:hypothetical protein MesoLjLc_00600 [Mesorhizobium sp. L-8-10]|uniref:DUF1236 domain-containing protein n=1 Tax=Mesorhizobium sp. L-8-10 TaxID=2744523 RepID=UPI001927BC9D|nr:DUF1236 domain-containing protein [Mesorhizobium sp. L-8-10]BCH28130.1 hypothetical protein MesoLjLc_00600 [Mesorhizobium sp. L-8-10]
MRKILFASVAISALTLGAYAQEAPVQSPNAPAAERAMDDMTTQSTNPRVDAGVAVGGTAGAVTGAVVAGPVGAVVGGFAGAMLGSATAVPDPAVDYVVAHPTRQVVIEGGVRPGVVVPAAVAVTPIPEYPQFGYFYSEGRPVVVSLENREMLYSPGYVVRDEAIGYVRANPSDPVVIERGATVGTIVPETVQLVEIPADPAYGYVYTDEGPVVVNRGSRTVVWVQNQ